MAGKRQVDQIAGRDRLPAIVRAALSPAKVSGLASTRDLSR